MEYRKFYSVNLCLEGQGSRYTVCGKHHMAFKKSAILEDSTVNSISGGCRQEHPQIATWAISGTSARRSLTAQFLFQF
jgi:hypothetical protein